MTLNRPTALNALTLSMVQQIDRALDRWRTEPLSCVLIESSSPKAFCAGGDIRAVRENTLNGTPEISDAFFTTEYRVNHTLATYPHPVIALIDGICMGGGLGLSVHGPFRVVTERAVLAMPETAIGFFPDVGASHFLARMPGALGMYLGLTGTRLNANDAVYSGLATHQVLAQELPDLIGALTAADRPSIEETVRRFTTHPVPDSPLADHRDEIDWCFGAPNLPAIKERLAQVDTGWSWLQLETLTRASPQSLAICFELISRGRERDLAACLDAELATTHQVTTSHDFIEGVRAVLVDKDHRPRWAATDESSTIGPIDPRS